METNRRQERAKTEYSCSADCPETVLAPDPATFPTCNRDNMARSKDKKKDAENGEADETKDDSRIDEPTMDYEELVKRVCVIAKPLASRKLTKRLYKTVKKGKRGVYLYGLMAYVSIAI